MCENFSALFFLPFHSLRLVSLLAHTVLLRNVFCPVFSTFSLTMFAHSVLFMINALVKASISRKNWEPKKCKLSKVKVGQIIFSLNWPGGIQTKAKHGKIWYKSTLTEVCQKGVPNMSAFELTICCWPFMSGKLSVTRFDYFWNVLLINFLTKEALMFENFWGYLEKHHGLSKNWCDYLLTKN